jgi:hypothetical protein
MPDRSSFEGENALEEKEIDFLGWRGPPRAAKIVKKMLALGTLCGTEFAAPSLLFIDRVFLSIAFASTVMLVFLLALMGPETPLWHVAMLRQ